MIHSVKYFEPVDVEDLSLIDYNDVIKKPMDFSTLRQNVLEKMYITISKHLHMTYA